MLIGSLGAPSSGKTTVVSGVIYCLKQNAIPCNFIAEISRSYILEHFKRYGDVALDEVDQISIYKKQRETEALYADKAGYNISDTCVPNSLFYGVSYCNFVEEMNKYDFILYHNLVHSKGADHVRIHDFDFSETMDREIRQLLESTKDDLTTRIIELDGDPATRVETVLTEIRKI